MLQPIRRRLKFASASSLLSATFLTTHQQQRKPYTNMSTSQTDTTSSPGLAWMARPYEPRHAKWPYSDADFARQDPSPDASFYDTPRFVTHIDDEAVASLRSYYDAVLPRRGRILDLCSSWVSHYPPDIEKAAAAVASQGGGNGGVWVTGMGMNRAELAANPVLNSGRVVVDLNEQPDVARALKENSSAGGTSQEHKFDACTLVVSIDYLTRPVDVLKSLRSVMKEGSVVHLTISNRCFPTKAIARWLKISEDERLQMVGDYLHFAGWKEIEIVELIDGKPQQTAAASRQQGGLLESIFGVIGMGHTDPLWVVRGVNVLV